MSERPWGFTGSWGVVCGPSACSLLGPVVPPPRGSGRGALTSSWVTAVVEVAGWLQGPGAPWALLVPNLAGSECPRSELYPPPALRRRPNADPHPCSERGPYCVDENTERRNHYLDLAGIENYASKFGPGESRGPGPQAPGLGVAGPGSSGSSGTEPAPRRPSRLLCLQGPPRRRPGRSPPPGPHTHRAGPAHRSQTCTPPTIAAARGWPSSPCRPLSCCPGPWTCRPGQRAPSGRS